MSDKIDINKRQYNKSLSSTVVVICLDGSQKEYIDIASSKGLTPNLDKILENGQYLMANSAIPSFTNPNNISIVTGQPSDVHGISGNFFYTPSTGEEVMMNDPQYLRAPTIFEKYYNEGYKIAVITAKDKLRTLLGNGLKFNEGRAICFSSEKSDQATLSENGIENINDWIGMKVPEVYSQDLSEFVMAAGVKLLEEFNPDIMYLSTTDFIQHKYAPGDKEANDFYQMFDKYVSKICSNGNSVVITADHGMKSKANINGEPNAIFLQDYLDDQMGKDAAKVILPITDPYVVHHGSLGSFATIYVKDKSKIDETISKISSIKEIEVVVKQDEACREYRLPSDRIGDIVCMSSEDMTIGTSKANHDLSKLKEPLRSHGGHHEREVPFISNKKLNIAKDQSLNNYDAFFYAINGA